MKSSRSFWPVILASGALILTACGNSAGGTEADTGTLRITNTSCPCFLPNMVAIEQGFVEEELEKVGAEVEIQMYEDGPSQTAALLSDSLDVAQYGSTAVASLLDQNAPTTVFYISDKVLETEGLAVRSGEGIDQVADLKGKTVGVLQGSTSDYGLRGSLANAGLSTSDIDVLNLAPPAMKSAWDRGDIDAAYVWSPFLDQLKASDGHMLESIGDLGRATDDEYQIMNLYVARSDFAEENPELLKAYTRALDRGVAYIEENPEEVAENVYTDLGVNSPEEVLVFIEGEQYFTSSDQTALLSDIGTTGSVGPLIVDGWQFGVDSQSLSSEPSNEAVNELLDSDYVEDN